MRLQLLHCRPTDHRVKSLRNRDLSAMSFLHLWLKSHYIAAADLESRGRHLTSKTRGDSAYRLVSCAFFWIIYRNALTRVHQADIKAHTAVEDNALTDPINLSEKFSSFSDYWSPKIVASFNEDEVMVVRVKDEFVWHSHPETDDFFLVVEGELEIELRDSTVKLKAGELFVVPKGVEHRPVARNGVAKVLIIEPKGTPNTGGERTAAVKVAI